MIRFSFFLKGGLVFIVLLLFVSAALVDTLPAASAQMNSTSSTVQSTSRPYRIVQKGAVPVNIFSRSASNQQKPPLAPNTIITNSVDHGYQHEEGREDIRPIGPGERPLSINNDGPAGPVITASLSFTPTCSSADMVGLSPVDLVDYLTQTNMRCLYFLWSYDSNVSQVLTDAHLSAVINRLQIVIPTYNGTNQDHINELLFFVRIVHYHAFFYPSSVHIGTTVRSDVNTMLLAFSQHINFLYNSGVGGSITSEWVNIVDAANLSSQFYSTFVSIIQIYNNDSTRWGSYFQDYTIYSVLYSINRQAVNNNSNFILQVDQKLISELQRISVNTTLLPQSEYVVTNAVYTLGGFISIARLQSRVIAAFEMVYHTHEYLSSPYLWVLEILNRTNLCPIATITRCKADVIPDIEARVFPERYSFDDYSMVVYTSLPLSAVQVLYHASKEVQSQFNRLVGTFTPISNDPNNVLIMKVYGSRSEYERYQTFLYDLGTNNGGIYIEQTGTFYTYQRTQAESIYTLEELFRHEYVHYLVGRYLIGGMWGTEPIYASNRMVWFDEGAAEFLTWSTPTDIQVRRLLVSLIQANGLSGRMTINSIVHSTYSNFEFYRYAGLLFNYLYENDKLLLHNLFAAARAGDITTFDSLVNQLATDPVREAAFQQYITDQISRLSVLSNPSTQFVPVELLSTNSISAIQKSVESTQYGVDSVCAVSERAETNARFSCRGVLQGAVENTFNYVSSWNTFHAQLNSMIIALHDLSSGFDNNFQAMVCRFGQIRTRVVGVQVRAETDYYCDGPLLQGAYPLPPRLQKVTEDVQSTVLGAAANCVLVGSDKVTCQVQVESGIFSLATAPSVLVQDVENNVTSLQNQIYAIHPSYYSKLSCVLTGAATTRVSGSSQYRIQNVLCTLP